MIADIWLEFLKIAKEEVGSRVVDTWFKAVSLRQWDALNQRAYLEAPNEFVRDWVKSNYTTLIQTHLSRLFNVESLKVIFISACAPKDEPAVAQKIEPEKQQSTMSIVPAVATPLPVQRSPMQPPMVKNHGHVNRTYSFDTFVVGPSNSLAYAAAYAVTEKPWRIYNPLFIYGNSGLGNTHLLHAIGNGIKMRNKRTRTLYQTTDRFVNEFISAIRFDKVHRFHAKYKNVDVLLIDDIQFMVKKEQTQEAFFHIFNTLYDAQKQIVFTSDTMPGELNGLAERLRSRLAWGLVTDIHIPPLETKVAILKKKAEMSGEVLDDEVAHFIASRGFANIRELEGSLIRVMAFASLTKQSMSLELAQRVLVRTQQERKIEALGFSHVLKGVCKHFPYSYEELTSKRRSKDLSFTRQIAMFLMKKMTEKSLRDIGIFFGGRDHSTVMHAINKIEERARIDVTLSLKLKQLQDDIARSAH